MNIFRNRIFRCDIIDRHADSLIFRWPNELNDNEDYEQAKKNFTEHS